MSSENTPNPKFGEFYNIIEYPSVIAFFGGYLSNFFPCSFMLDGCQFNSVEQAYMAKKAAEFNDEESLVKIFNLTNPYKIKKAGQQIKNFNELHWNLIKVDVMFSCCWAKFTSNINLRNNLLSTTKPLVEANPWDSFWGCGLYLSDPTIDDPSKHPGENKLGLVLEKVRSKL